MQLCIIMAVNPGQKVNKRGLKIYIYIFFFFWCKWKCFVTLNIPFTSSDIGGSDFQINHHMRTLFCDFWWDYMRTNFAMLGFIKIDPISEIGPIFMGHGGIQQVSAKRTSCGLTQAYLQ